MIMNDKKETIVEVADLTAAYGDTVILDNISFDVYKGEKFIILGGSGCGKSTLLKHMIGLYKPAHGSIIIEGEDIATAEGEERIEILKSIGVDVPLIKFMSTTWLPGLRRSIIFLPAFSPA